MVTRVRWCETFLGKRSPDGFASKRLYAVSLDRTSSIFAASVDVKNHACARAWKCQPKCIVSDLTEFRFHTSVLRKPC